MKWRKIIFGFVGTLSFISGAYLIVLSLYGMSLIPPLLGYTGGVVMIVYPGFLMLWELSRKPKLVKRK